MADTSQLSMDTDQEIKDLAHKLRRGDASAAARALEKEADEVVASVLERLPAPKVFDLMKTLPKGRAETIRTAVDEHKRQQWDINAQYPLDTIGRAMELPRATMGPDTTVAEATEQLRQIVKEVLVTLRLCHGTKRSADRSGGHA